MRLSNEILAIHCDRLRALVARLELGPDRGQHTALLEDLRNQVALMRELRRMRRRREPAATRTAPPSVG